MKKLKIIIILINIFSITQCNEPNIDIDVENWNKKTYKALRYNCNNLPEHNKSRVFRFYKYIKDNSLRQKLMDTILSQKLISSESKLIFLEKYAQGSQSYSVDVIDFKSQKGFSYNFYDKLTKQERLSPNEIFDYYKYIISAEGKNKDFICDIDIEHEYILKSTTFITEVVNNLSFADPQLADF